MSTEGGGVIVGVGVPAPFVKFPTNGANLGNNAHEGGVILPLSVSLPHDWNMGCMAEFDFNQNSEDKDYHTEYIQSITFGHQIVGDLNGYVEFFSQTIDDVDMPWIATFDTGVTYQLTQDIQFDGGVNLGLTKNADDFNPFVGLTLRY